MADRLAWLFKDDREWWILSVVCVALGFYLALEDKDLGSFAMICAVALGGKSGVEIFRARSSKP